MECIQVFHSEAFSLSAFDGQKWIFYFCSRHAQLFVVEGTLITV